MSETTIMEHPCGEVQSAIIQLCDALCMWERTTGRKSVVIIREEPDFVMRFMDGKPNVPDNVDDLLFLQIWNRRFDSDSKGMSFGREGKKRKS